MGCVVPISRIILVFSLSLATIGALAPATFVQPAEPSATATEHRDCCGQHKDSNPLPTSDCAGSSCAMQCCRVIPVPADSRQMLDGPTQFVEFAHITRKSFNSFTDAEDAFHPPRPADPTI
jgi:hypothetical protein